MNRIDQIFAEAGRDGRKLLMPFVCAGSPALASLPEVLPALEQGGASIVEVGIPYSDPIADGPVIAQSMHHALQRGMTPELVFEQVRSARSGVSAGLVAMVSYSVVHRFGGPDGFVRRAGNAGFDGFIFPDLPVEESGACRAACASAGATMSLLVAPTTPGDRAATIARACSGFVYVVARTGITGEGAGPGRIGPRVRALRSQTDLPIACGFGIAGPEQVRAVIEHADAAIVGSALVRRMDESPPDRAAETARAFCEELARGLGVRA